MLVAINKLSRFPEAVEVSGTSAQANIVAFDNIFSRHGFCKKLTTDGGPPFHGHDSHDLQKYFRWAGIEHNKTMSADDPEANGLAEAFMKIIKKIWHTCTITRRDPMAEINKRLQAYRATPHPTTGKAPAELMYGGEPTEQDCQIRRRTLPAPQLLKLKRLRDGTNPNKRNTKTDDSTLSHMTSEPATWPYLRRSRLNATHHMTHDRTA